MQIVHIGLSGEPKPFHALASAQELMETHQHCSELVVFLDKFWDNNIQDFAGEITKFVNVISRTKPAWRIFVLANSSDTHAQQQLHDTGAHDVLFVDFFLYRVYREVVIHKKCSIKNTVGTDTRKNKFLFLTGKVSKSNRIRLLKKLVDAGVMTKAEWSFFYYDHQVERNQRSRAWLPELSDQEFDEFVHTWINNPDNAIIAVTLKDLEYGGIPYNVKLYTDTDFSLISETFFSEGTTISPWITEKTWIPILNQQPFIMAGDVGTLATLRSMGFETYEAWYKDPNLDNINNRESRLDALVSTVQHWLENDFTQQQKIVAVHNAKVMYELYYKNLAKILEFIEKHQLPLTIDDVIPTHGRHDDYDPEKAKNKLFLNFYNNIKDTAWPECYSLSDFYKLPQEIQTECIETFGFIPPVN